MHVYHSSIRRQIKLIEDAMRESGIWSEAVPEWVHQYQGDVIPDIWQWLQFVYLPVRLEGIVSAPNYLAPQIRAHLSAPMTDNSLLMQRIIELDAMTSTIGQY